MPQSVPCSPIFLGDQILEVQIIVAKITNNLVIQFSKQKHVSEYIGIGGTIDRERKERRALRKCERMWIPGYHMDTLDFRVPGQD